MDENSALKSNANSKERKSTGILKTNNPFKTFINNQDILNTKINHPITTENVRNSSIKKVLNEATKIVKIGMAKEFALVERDTTIQVHT